MIPGLQWLRVLLDAAGPREWICGTPARRILHVFGDASEPDGLSGQRPMIGAILQFDALSPPRAFELEMPEEILASLAVFKKETHLFLRSHVAGGRGLHMERPPRRQRARLL